ncbi:MAG: type II secretion system protein [Patescibacteria group bacterium]
MANLGKKQKGFTLVSRACKGFTLVEVLIVISIVVMLAVIVFGMLKQINKGRDGQRKDDLETIRIAFEDYFNDHGCYPETNVLEECDGDELVPYLNSIPCDPQTNEPYVVLTEESGCNNWYKVYSLLENTDDLAIAKLGLSTTPIVDGQLVNYGVSSPNVSVGSAVYTCPSGQPPVRATTCHSPDDYLGECGTGYCGCVEGERIVGSDDEGYYCCQDETCP